MAPETTQPMKIALCTIAFRERLLEYSLDVARECSFDGVEIWGREPHISEVYDANRVAAARKMVADHGLEIAAFGSYLRFGATQPEQLTLRDMLQIGADLEVPVMRVWASDVPSVQADEKLWARTVAEAREAACAADKLGMRLAVEMHSNTLADTGASARRLVDEVGHPALGLNYQAAPRLDEEDALARLELVLPHVLHFHAQNYLPLNGSLEKVERVGLSEGAIDYAPLVQRLRETGYQGYLAVEFCPSNHQDKRAALKADCAYLRSL